MYRIFCNITNPFPQHVCPSDTTQKTMHIHMIRENNLSLPSIVRIYSIYMIDPVFKSFLLILISCCCCDNIYIYIYIYIPTTKQQDHYENQIESNQIKSNQIKSNQIGNNYSTTTISAVRCSVFISL